MEFLVICDRGPPFPNHLCQIDRVDIGVTVRQDHYFFILPSGRGLAGWPHSLAPLEIPLGRGVPARNSHGVAPFGNSFSKAICAPAGFSPPPKSCDVGEA